MAVPVDGTGTASVAPVMAPPVSGVQKPPRRVGKRFWDRLVVAPGRKVKKPAGLKMRAAWLPEPVENKVVWNVRCCAELYNFTLH